MAMKTAIATTAATSGSVVIYPQGNAFAVVRFVQSGASSTYNYVVRIALTPDETPSTGHAVAGASASGGASTLVPIATSGGAPIPCHAIHINYNTLSGGGNMTVFVNTGETGR